MILTRSRQKISNQRVYIIMPIKSQRSKSKSKGPLPKATNIPAKYSYQNMMKNHELKHANIQFRNDLLRARANAAYKNEYDRTHSILHNHKDEKK